MPHVVPDPDTPQHRVRGEELRRRIELVRAKLLAGNTRRWVAKLIASEWGLKPSQCWAYVRKAEAEIREFADRDAATWLHEHIAIRRDIRRRANDAADLRTELSAAESEARLLGLEPPTRLQHSGPGGGLIPIGVADLTRLNDGELETIETILAKLTTPRDAGAAPRSGPGGAGTSPG
jgi:hypothetical protein